MLELELTTLGWTLACGAGLGFVFDFWRACRAVLRPGWIVTSAGDLIFWLVAVLLAAGTLILANYGQVRLYVFLSLAIGFLLYQFLLSPLLRRPLRWLIRAVFRGLERLGQGLLLPVRLPLNLVLSIGRTGARGGRRLGRAALRLFWRKLAFLRPKKRP